MATQVGFTTAGPTGGDAAVTADTPKEQRLLVSNGPLSLPMSDNPELSDETAVA